MSEEGRAGIGRADQRRDPLFNVVHDPLTDRFFLQERGEQETNATTRDGQATGTTVGAASGSFPWEQVVLPPRFVTTSTAAARDVASSVSGSRPGTTESPTSATTVDPTEVNAVASTQDASNTRLADNEQTIAGRPLYSPTRRARCSNNRLSRTAILPDGMAALLLNLPEHCDATKRTRSAIKWNGEPVSVHVVGLAAADSAGNNDAREGWEEDLDPRIAQPTDRYTERDHGQWLAHTYDLKQLARIRPSADGFRDQSVNIGCTFPPIDPWSSASDSDEVEQEQQEEELSSSEENDLPVFQRGDRVVFRLPGYLNEMAGRVTSRVHYSVFYDVQGSDGRVFKSVYAGNMTLRPTREPKPHRKPRYRFAKHDKVLWLPFPEEKASSADANNDSDDHEQATYKARVLQVRSLDRFDLLLRTGRVVKRVPYDQLRPRNHF